MSEPVESAVSSVEHVAKRLTPEEVDRMRAQDSRLVPEFRASQLERDAKKHWDLFYKRNDTRFFRDRRWTTREFGELLSLGGDGNQNVLLEVGCGVGNFIYPLMEDGLEFRRIFACDLSTRAIELLKVSPRPAGWDFAARDRPGSLMDLFFFVEPRVVRSGNGEGLSNGRNVGELLRRDRLFG